jgi:hypothetical protein
MDKMKPILMNRDIAYELRITHQMICRIIPTTFSGFLKSFHFQKTIKKRKEYWPYRPVIVN